MKSDAAEEERDEVGDLPGNTHEYGDDDGAGTLPVGKLAQPRPSRTLLGNIGKARSLTSLGTAKGKDGSQEGSPGLSSHAGTHSHTSTANEAWKKLKKKSKALGAISSLGMDIAKAPLRVAHDVKRGVFGDHKHDLSHSDAGHSGKSDSEPTNESDKDTPTFAEETFLAQQRVATHEMRRKSAIELHDSLHDMLTSNTLPSTVFEGGAKFKGPLNSEGLPHGVGVIEQMNKESYHGQFKNGRRHGFGYCSYPNGDSYRGDWKEDMKDGRGSYMYEQGHSYEGQWRRNQKDGEGEQKWSNGDSYSGQWYHGRVEGEGVFTWASKTKYEGQWKRGQKHGNGMWTDGMGRSFHGKWERGKVISCGKLTDPNRTGSSVDTPMFPWNPLLYFNFHEHNADCYKPVRRRRVRKGEAQEESKKPEEKPGSAEAESTERTRRTFSTASASMIEHHRHRQFPTYT